MLAVRWPSDASLACCMLFRIDETSFKKISVLSSPCPRSWRKLTCKLSIPVSDGRKGVSLCDDSRQDSSAASNLGWSLCSENVLLAAISSIFKAVLLMCLTRSLRARTITPACKFSMISWLSADSRATSRSLCCTSCSLLRIRNVSLLVTIAVANSATPMRPTWVEVPE